MNEAAWLIPRKVTDDEARKPVPFIVRVSELVPAAAELGDRPVIAGAGFWLGGGCTTVMVTVLEVAPPIKMTTGVAFPAATPAGTCTFTWYSLTKPGASPEKSTCAGTPPIITVGVAVVMASGLLGEAAPLAG